MNFKKILTPRGFLTVGGAIFVLIAWLGLAGVIGPTSEKSIFGSFWWFDNAENVAHLVLGLVSLAVVYLVKDAGMHKSLALVVGALGLLVGLYNLMGEVVILGANLESPADLIFHFVVGAWGLYAGLSARQT